MPAKIQLLMDFFKQFLSFAGHVDTSATSLLVQTSGDAPIPEKSGNFLDEIEMEMARLKNDSNELENDVLRPYIDALRVIIDENQAGLDELVRTLEQYGYSDAPPPPVQLRARALPDSGELGDAEQSIQPLASLEGMGISSATLALLQSHHLERASASPPEKEEEEEEEEFTEVIVQPRKRAATQQAPSKKARSEPLIEVSESDFESLPGFLKSQFTQTSLNSAISIVNKCISRVGSGSIEQAQLKDELKDKTKAVLLVLTTLKKLHRRFEGGKTLYSQ